MLLGGVVKFWNGRWRNYKKKKATSSEVGFAGPIGINVDCLLVDEEVTHMYNFVIGAKWNRISL